jgi:hypothetical protein
MSCNVRKMAKFLVVVVPSALPKTEPSGIRVKQILNPPTSSGHLVEIVRREMIRGDVENASVECL